VWAKSVVRKKRFNLHAKKYMHRTIEYLTYLFHKKIKTIKLLFLLKIDKEVDSIDIKITHRSQRPKKCGEK